MARDHVSLSRLMIVARMMSEAVAAQLYFEI